jgi:hypothetical protein
VSVRIDVAEDDAALKDLWEWLRAERDLRGHVRLKNPPAPPGTMGSGVEIAFQLADLGLAAVNTLVASVGAWLTYRAAHAGPATASVTINMPDGTSFELTHEDPAELARLAAALRGHLDGELDRDDDPAA